MTRPPLPRARTMLRVARSPGRLAFIVVACLIVLASCSPEERQGRSDANWNLLLEARFGSMDGPLTLQPIMSLTLSPDGETLYVVQWQVPSVLVLSASGDSLASIGQRGQGPGEFSGVMGVSVQRDTLWIGDMTGRVSRFTAVGEFMDQLRFPREPLGPNELPPRFTAPLSDGTILMEAGSGPGSAAVGLIEGAAYVRADRGGQVLDTAVVRSLAGGFLSVRFEDGGRAVGAHPVDWSDRVAVDPGGRWVVKVSMDPPSAGITSATVTWTEPGVGPFAEARVTATPQSSAEAYETLVEGLMRGRTTRSRAAVERAVSEQVPWPSSAPPVTGVFADSDGRAWVKTTHAQPDSAAWWILGSDGRELGRAVLPARVELLAASGETVWGWTRGAFDEHDLLRFRVEP